jgi:hypothetical protein
MMHCLLELELREPSAMQLRPCRPPVMTALAQQEAGRLLTGAAQCPYRVGACSSQTPHRRRRVRDPAILPHLAPCAALGDRHDDPVLVNIKPNIRDTIPQDPSPMPEARHRPTRRNPRYLHTVRRVAPSSSGHVV